MVHFQSPGLWHKVQELWESYSRVVMGKILVSYQKKWTQDVKGDQGPKCFLPQEQSAFLLATAFIIERKHLKKKKNLKAQVFLIHNLYRARQTKKTTLLKNEAEVVQILVV